jgi:hypothetical protein
MKKIFLSFAALAACSMVSMLVFNQGALYSNATGAPASGPCTSCHAGSVQTNTNMMIMFEDENGDEATTYQAGKTYDVTVMITGISSSKAGFALSASQGTLSVESGNPLVQKITNYLTHTSSGTTTVSGVAVWAGQWTAPAAGSANVTFQAYINASNNDNTNNGDVIYGKSLVVAKGTTGLSDVMGGVSYDIYPNPVSDLLTVKLDLKKTADLNIAVYRIDGALARTLYNGTESAGSVSKQFSVSGYAKGVYFLEITTGKERSIQKLMIN